MHYDFDTLKDRKGSDSAKWKKYGDEVLPLWVADMDFVSAQPIVDVLRQRADHGVFGYGGPPGELACVIQEPRYSPHTNRHSGS